VFKALLVIGPGGIAGSEGGAARLAGMVGTTSVWLSPSHGTGVGNTPLMRILWTTLVAPVAAEAVHRPMWFEVVLVEANRRPSGLQLDALSFGVEGGVRLISELLDNPPACRR
jgi:drug/metabolite transporter (DMT)-like permease